MGKILVSIREEIINGSDWEKWIIDQRIESNEKRRGVMSLVVIKEDKPSDKLLLEKKAMFFFGGAD